MPSAALPSGKRSSSYSTLSNLSDAKQGMKLAISDAKLASQAKLRQMAPSKQDAADAVGKMREGAVEERSLGDASGAIEAPPSRCVQERTRIKALRLTTALSEGNEAG